MSRKLMLLDGISQSASPFCTLVGVLEMTVLRAFNPRHRIDCLFEETAVRDRILDFALFCLTWNGQRRSWEIAIVAHEVERGLEVTDSIHGCLAGEFCEPILENVRTATVSRSTFTLKLNARGLVAA